MGVFRLEDGYVQPDVFLLDTTRIRVEGEGSIDLQTGAIGMSFRPRPKRPQFFSLATPVNITGTILDYSIGVHAGGVLATFFRQVSSVITVPVMWLFSERMEADGSGVCPERMADVNRLE